jgi:2-iminobutanoate/2-iminopropanoate deaminase
MIQKIETQNAPAPIGPYSQAIRFENLIWVSGCIALQPETSAMTQENIEAETTQVMHNLKAILEAGGSSMSKILKTTIFLTDMNQFSIVNEIYGKFLQSPYPARETVQVSALPKGANVEISCMAMA